MERTHTLGTLMFLRLNSGAFNYGVILGKSFNLPEMQFLCLYNLIHLKPMWVSLTWEDERDSFRTALLSYGLP